MVHADGGEARAHLNQLHAPTSTSTPIPDFQGLDVCVDVERLVEVERSVWSGEPLRYAPPPPTTGSQPSTGTFAGVPTVEGLPGGWCAPRSTSQPHCRFPATFAGRREVARGQAAVGMLRCGGAPSTITSQRPCGVRGVMKVDGRRALLPLARPAKSHDPRSPATPN